MVKQERFPIIQLDENGLVHVKCPKADFIRSLGWIDKVFSDFQINLHEICQRSSYIRGQKLYFLTEYAMHSVIVTMPVIYLFRIISEWGLGQKK